MEQLVASQSTKWSRPPEALTFARATEILWESAWEALILAFLVLAFGSIAFGLVSGVWREMSPSLPPGLTGEPKLEAEGSASALSFSFFRQNRLGLIFLVLFSGIAAGRLLKYSGSEHQRRAAAQVGRILRRVSNQWLSLVVINAFLALVGVIIIEFSQQFTLTQLLWNTLGDLVRAGLQAIATLFPAGAVSFVEGFVAWYKANHYKFIFWLLYTAAICDDLGLPNYKALGRFLWRRLFKRKYPVAQPAGSTSSE
jgi:ABC-type Fe3+-siderophore transport system permease subunit